MDLCPLRHFDFSAFMLAKCSRRTYCLSGTASALGKLDVQSKDPCFCGTDILVGGMNMYDQ